MEEGIFPGYRSIGEPGELEEERRLCYVGITRAKEYLFLTCSKIRTIFGSTSCNKISRFIDEIPENLRKGDIKPEKEYSFEDRKYDWKYGQNKKAFEFRTVESFLNNLDKKQQELDLTIYKVGQTVSHKKFGVGKINSIEKEGEDLKLSILFEKSGIKRLMAKYAGLEIIA
jgi:DNA helicase-2/ATP-dependent DNA helicase PcrA